MTNDGFSVSKNRERPIETQEPSWDSNLRYLVVTTPTRLLELVEEQKSVSTSQWP